MANALSFEVDDYTERSTGEFFACPEFNLYMLIEVTDGHYNLVDMSDGTLYNEFSISDIDLIVPNDFSKVTGSIIINPD
jgi:hypothetical protein